MFYYPSQNGYFEARLHGKRFYLQRFAKSALIFSLLILGGSPPVSAAKPIQILEGEYRLGDSPQTPEDGLAWLTVDPSSPDWLPYRIPEGHDSGQFTNVWRRIKLPDTALMDPTLYVANWPAFEAYVDNKIVYNSGVLRPDPRNRFSSHAWHLVPIPLNFAGKHIYFRIYSERPSSIRVNTPVTVASRSDHLIAMVRKELAQATVGLFLILIGFGAIYVYLRRQFKPALNLGFFSVSVGLFSTMHTDIASLLIMPGYLAWYLTHIPLYLFPIGLWKFLDTITDGDCLVLGRLAQFQAVYAAGVVVVDAFGYYPMYMTTLYQGILAVSIAISTVVVSRYLLRQLAEPGADSAEAKLLGTGFTVLTLSGVHDLLAGLGIIPFLVPCFHFGVLGFVVTLAVVLERRFTLAHDQLRSYSRNLERRVVERTKDLGEKNSELERAMGELKEAQHQLVMREKMASLGDLVAGVAHEVNTPIGAVNSSADVSGRCIEKLSDLVDAHPEAASLKEEKGYQQAIQILKKNTGLIKNAGDRIARIVLSLRSFARLGEAEFQEADLHEGLNSTLDLVNHQIKGKIDIVKDYASDVPEVECYPNQLNQVFMNLLVNASQAIDDTGTITITTRLSEGQVRVSVQDSGRGISEENLTHIFDPGFTTKGVGVGTGLGLSISYKIIEDHNGKIDVKSTPGQGSTFTVTIPTEQPEPP